MRGPVLLALALGTGCGAEPPLLPATPALVAAAEAPAPLPELGEEPAPVPAMPGAPAADTARPEPAADEQVSQGQTFHCHSESLPWHKAHQSPDGAWRCATFSAHCRKNVCDGAGASDEHTVATTSLMLLAYLGAGHTTRTGKHREVVQRGVRCLRSLQQPDGRVGDVVRGGVAPYNHALATLALCEAVGLLGGPSQAGSLAEPARRALDHVLATQSVVGVWASTADPRWGDAALTAWSCFALLAARPAGFDVPERALDAADRWFDWATDHRTGLVGWRRRWDTGERPAGMLWMPDARALRAAIAAFRLLRGVDPSDQRVAHVLDAIHADPPAWEPAEQRDFLYWWFGTMAMFRTGGLHWRDWSAAMKEAVVKTQRRGADEDGTWDPCDLWGPEGGRVYATAVNILSLEIHYRYAKVLGGPGKKLD